MLNIDDWVWERSKYWWDQLNRTHHTLFEIPPISISDRVTKQAGYCSYKQNKVEVTLYDHYIKKIGDRYDQTIAHELAHAHNYFLYHKMGHGRIWKQTMLKLGLKPDVYHNYNFAS